MTVFIPKNVYLTIVAACGRYANKRIDKDDWLEVNGILEEMKETMYILQKRIP